MKKISLRLILAILAFLTLAAPRLQDRVQAQEERPTIALTIPFAGAPFYWAAAHGFKDEGERLGYNIIINNAENSIERQVAHIDNYRVTNVVGAAAIALDADALVPAIEAYMEDGRPFFAIDRDIRGPVTGLLVTDNVVAGKRLGQYVREQIGDAPINALVLYGPVSVVPFVDRLNGFLSAFQDADNFTLVGTPDAGVDPSRALSIVTTFLQSNPEINVIYSVTDLTNSGAIAAVEQANRMVPDTDPNHIWIIGVDGNGETLEQVREGTTDASYSQYPYLQGVWTVRSIDYVIQGLGDSVPSGLFFGGDVVTPYNIDTFPNLWGDIEFGQDIVQ